MSGGVNVKMILEAGLQDKGGKEEKEDGEAQ